MGAPNPLAKPEENGLTDLDGCHTCMKLEKRVCRWAERLARGTSSGLNLVHSTICFGPNLGPRAELADQPRGALGTSTGSLRCTALGTG